VPDDPQLEPLGAHLSGSTVCGSALRRTDVDVLMPINPLFRCHQRSASGRAETIIMAALIGCCRASQAMLIPSSRLLS
jgi:hypothetical protein